MFHSLANRYLNWRFVDLSLEAEVTLCQLIFLRAPSLTIACFRSETSFTESKFGGDLIFHALAKEGLDFSGSKFAGSVKLTVGVAKKKVLTCNKIGCDGSFTIVAQSGFDAMFEFKSSYVRGGFRVEGNYGSKVHLSGSRFGGKFSFPASVSSRFNAHGCQFDEDADFNGSNFSSTADLGGSKFLADARFDCKFASSTWFNECRFDKRSDFSTYSSDRSIGPISFEGSHFYGELLFINRIFSSTTNFSKCEFAVAPEFHGATLHQDTRLPGIDAFKQRKTENASAAYRTLRQAMERNNARREEAMFYALEQKTLRQIPGAQSSWENFASALYDFASRYGVNFWRPLAGLILVISIFGLGYGWWIGWPLLKLTAVRDGMIFSLQQVVNPFWIWRATEPPGATNWPNAVKLVATAQSLVSTGLLALALLALRWRFKRE